jgi:hypothetical protein
MNSSRSLGCQRTPDILRADHKGWAAHLGCKRYTRDELDHARRAIERPSQAFLAELEQKLVEA